MTRIYDITFDEMLTTGSTPETITVYTCPNSSVMRIDCRVIGRTTSGSSITKEFTNLIKVVDSVASIVDNVTVSGVNISDESLSTCLIQSSISGDTVLIEISGVSGVEISWAAYTTYIIFSEGSDA